MKGLILNDILIGKNNSIVLLGQQLGQLLVFLILTFVSPRPEIVLIFVFFSSYIKTYRYLIMDRMNNWEVYKLTFPISKAMVVKSKFYLIFIDTIVFLLLHLLTVLLIRYPIRGFNLGVYFNYLYFISMGMIVLINIFIILILKWGFEKTSSVTVFIFLSLGYIFYKADLSSLIPYMNIVKYLLGLILVILFTFVSYKGSVEIYRAKDL